MVLIHSSVVILRARREQGEGESYHGPFQKGQNRNALCLGDELMKLADETLEDELYASVHARIHIWEREEQYNTSRTGLGQAQ
jgi:hypothetical protein